MQAVSDPNDGALATTPMWQPGSPMGVIASRIHTWARGKGWWDTERNAGEIYMNIASEVSEAWEEWRKPDLPPMYYDVKTNKPEGELVELADCVIRIMDFCRSKGWDLEAAMLKKMEYNETRPHRHGGMKA